MFTCACLHLEMFQEGGKISVMLGALVKFASCLCTWQINQPVEKLISFLVACFKDFATTMLENTVLGPSGVTLANM